MLSLQHLQKTEVQPLSTNRGPLCTCSCITHLRDSLILFLFCQAELQNCTVTRGSFFTNRKGIQGFPTTSLQTLELEYRSVCGSYIFLLIFKSHLISHAFTLRRSLGSFTANIIRLGCLCVWVSELEIGWLREWSLMWFSHQQMIKDCTGADAQGLNSITSVYVIRSRAL